VENGAREKGRGVANSLTDSKDGFGVEKEKLPQKLSEKKETGRHSGRGPLRSTSYFKNKGYWLIIDRSRRRPCKRGLSLMIMRGVTITDQFNGKTSRFELKRRK